MAERLIYGDFCGLPWPPLCGRAARLRLSVEDPLAAGAHSSRPQKIWSVQPLRAHDALGRPLHLHRTSVFVSARLSRALRPTTTCGPFTASLAQGIPQIPFGSRQSVGLPSDSSPAPLRTRSGTSWSLWPPMHPPGCVAHRLHTPGMRAPRALPGGRLDAHSDQLVPDRVLSAGKAAWSSHAVVLQQLRHRLG
jgi:hypothetical protein